MWQKHFSLSLGYPWIYRPTVLFNWNIPSVLNGLSDTCYFQGCKEVLIYSHCFTLNSSKWDTWDNNKPIYNFLNPGVSQQAQHCHNHAPDIITLIIPTLPGHRHKNHARLDQMNIRELQVCSMWSSQRFLNLLGDPLTPRERSCCFRNVPKSLLCRFHAQNHAARSKGKIIL